MKIDVISGFLGAGKTTFLNGILPHLGEKVVIIENEYGDIAVDGNLIDGDLPVREIMAGCICCSLVLDFQTAITELAERFQPERIIIEPSGVSCLSDVVKACERVRDKVAGGVEIDRLITIVDLTGFADYLENFGAFYANQIENANVIMFSHLADAEPGELEKAIAEIRRLNPAAAIWEQEWYGQDMALLREWLADLAPAAERLDPEQKRVIFNAHDVFGAWSVVSERVWSPAELEALFAALDSGECGRILRAKGIVRAEGGRAVNFNYTPYHHEYHEVAAEGELGKTAVIGCKLNVEKLGELL